jgi:hypothetical protein
MAKESILDELRIYLEGVENYWLAITIAILFFTVIAVITLTGVYFYTRHH